MAGLIREDTARTLADGEQVIGRVNPTRILQLSVHVKVEGDTLEHVAEQRSLFPLHVLEKTRGRQVPAGAVAPTCTPGPEIGAHLSREDFAQQFAAKRSDFARVYHFARQSGFSV